MLKMYRTMVNLQHADQVLYDLQRQGSISFYMTGMPNKGKEVFNSKGCFLFRDE